MPIAGRATDGRDVPLAATMLDVLARTRVPGAPLRRVAGVGTARDGSFTYLAPAGVSRDVRIGSATAKLVVRAAGTLRAARRGRTVTLTGRLAGGHIPRGGVLVEVPGAGTARTDGRGRFALRYRGRRLSFHAVARKDSLWPFEPGRFAATRLRRPGAP